MWQVYMEGFSNMKCPGITTGSLHIQARVLVPQTVAERKMWVACGRAQCMYVFFSPQIVYTFLRNPDTKKSDRKK